MVRRILIIVLVFVVAAVVTLAFLKYYTDKHFYDGYSAEYPLNSIAEEPTLVDGTVEAFHNTLPAHYRRQRIEFETQPGERVPAILTLPVNATEPVPVLILLHGSHQEKEFVEEICTPFNEAGFAMVCFDQHMRGERKVRGSVLKTMKAFRDRCYKTVHDTRRLIDYLATRPDIDSKRVYLIGASYGAITGTVVVAQEKRIRAAALVVGGGNFMLLANAPEVRKELPKWLWPVAGPLMVVAAGAADPIHHAAQTAGTPVIMLNGSNDGVVTPESGKALYEVLGEPKEIRWYPIDHPDREPKGEEVLKMLSDGLEWFMGQDTQFRPSPPKEPTEDGT